MEFQLQHMVPLRRSQTLVSPELSLQHHNRRLAEAWGGCLGPELGSYKLFTCREAGMSPLCHSSLGSVFGSWCFTSDLHRRMAPRSQQRTLLLSGGRSGVIGGCCGCFPASKFRGQTLKYVLHTHTRHVCVFWVLLRSTTIHYNPLHPPVIPQSPLPCQVCMTSGAGTYHWMAPEALVN